MCSSSSNWGVHILERLDTVIVVVVIVVTILRFSLRLCWVYEGGREATGTGKSNSKFVFCIFCSKFLVSSIRKEMWTSIFWLNIFLPRRVSTCWENIWLKPIVRREMSLKLTIPLIGLSIMVAIIALLIRKKYKLCLINRWVFASYQQSTTSTVLTSFRVIHFPKCFFEVLRWTFPAIQHGTSWLLFLNKLDNGVLSAISLVKYIYFNCAITTCKTIL